MFKLSRHDAHLCVLRGAVSIDGASAGILFGATTGRRQLTIEDELGASPPMVAFARSLSPGDGSATGNAIAQRHRVVIRDVAADYAEHPRKQRALDAGIHAITATPLISTRLRTLGVITLYYSRPHHPSYDAIRRLDSCSRVASLLQEALELQETDGTPDAGSDVRRLRLSPVGQRAADAVSRLLPVCGRAEGDDALFITLTRHLDSLIRELSASP